LAEVEPKLYRDPGDFVDGVAVAPIAKGQPVTLALVLPAE
jgi:hypothetical protein